ncbi:ATP-binding protein [Carnimonas nigrificans]|uniref:ATP-binding protein n=1 Tax=Carnimonas nigrificans TaxID=64323 RepID=UPI0004706B1D|nr:ATP-binding protein [Carnimonas nigrificans]
MHSSIAPIIAVIGCDGSGKSTVCEHLTSWIEGFGPAQQVHLGKQSGNVGRAIAQWPIVGGFLHRKIDSKSKKANTSMDKRKLPDLLPALVMSAFTIRRLRRFKRMLKLREEGNIIVADRYPQTAIDGAYDGPRFPRSDEGSAIVRALARHERKAFDWMTSVRPTLVVRLNVDLDVACARKPDHQRAALARKIEVTPQLSYKGAPIADIDTNQALDKVLADVEEAVTKVMEAQGYHLHDNTSANRKTA